MLKIIQPALHGQLIKTLFLNDTSCYRRHILISNHRYVAPGVTNRPCLGELVICSSKYIKQKLLKKAFYRVISTQLLKNNKRKDTAKS